MYEIRELFPIFQISEMYEERTANTELYRAYKRFCEENGEYLRSHRRLSQNLQERGFRQMKSGGRYWDGIKILVSN